MAYQTGVLLVLISGICYGSIAIFTVYAYQEGLNTINFTFYRYLFSTIAFFLYLLVCRIKIKLNREQFLQLFILGGVINLLQSILFVASIKYISAGLATLLFFTHPILVAVLAYFEGERLSWMTIVSIFIAFGGLTLVMGTSLGKISTIGVALSLVAALVYAFFIILGNRTVKDIHPAVMCTFVSLFTIITLFPIALFYGGGLTFPSTTMGLVAAVGCGILGSTIPFVLFFTGITAIGATTASIIANAEPVAAVGLSALLFSQHLTGMQLLGGVLILVGGTIAVLAKQQIAEEEIIEGDTS